jgi:hypothetical protein
MRIFVLASLAAAACTSTLTPSQFVSDLETAECNFEVQCHEMPDMATCRASTQFETLDLETIVADVQTKKVAFSSTAANGCLTAFQSLTCSLADLEQFPRAETDCNNTFTGTAGSGAACFFSEECAAGFGCEQTQATCDATTTCCTGTCVAVAPNNVAIGGSCDASTQCVATAYCSDMDETCKAFGTTAGAECEASDGCTAPLICNINQELGPTGTCITPAAHGATCDPTQSFPCAELGDYCDGGTMLCTSAVGAGSACFTTPSEAVCVAYDSCTNSVCVALATAGTACTAGSDGTSNCLNNLVCTNGSCVLPTLPAACN